MKLHAVNNLLLTAILIINAGLIALPFLPNLKYAAASHNGERQRLQHKISSTDEITPVAPNHANGLIIPAMLLDKPVYEGSIANQYKTLDRGIWRWPRSSTPDKGGNTVFLGHRFTYSQPQGVFYYLDKLKLGDEIGLWWQNKRYIYKVSGIRQVSPQETSIQDNTPDSRLTLFTCTLWLPKHRLVVTAKLMEAV